MTRDDTREAASALVEAIAKQCGTDVATIVDIIQRNRDAFCKAVTNVQKHEAKAKDGPDPVTTATIGKPWVYSSEVVFAAAERLTVGGRPMSEYDAVHAVLRTARRS